MTRIDIRPLRREDDEAIARIIREVLSEFDAVGEGFSSQDAELDAMFEAYAAPRSAYLVAELDGRVVGGSGIGPLTAAEPDVCELRKMYLEADARGRGVGRRLLVACLDAARDLGYRRCYLETLARMDRAQRLYEDFGFRPRAAPLGNTGHSGCNRWYDLAL